MLDFYRKLFFSGPYLASGKFGKALRLPNTFTQDDNTLSLGHHENNCFGNVSLCPNGVTISFWIYMFTHSYKWPIPATGPSFQLSAYTPTTNPLFMITLYNSSHQWYTSPGLIYDYWHHFAFVYTAKDGFMLYSDGYRHDPVTPTPHHKGPQNLLMGCAGSQHCTIAKYDDLRVWNEAKDEDFIWLLWQSRKNVYGRSASVDRCFHENI